MKDGNQMTTLNNLKKFQLSQTVVMYCNIILLFSNISDNH